MRRGAEEAGANAPSIGHTGPGRQHSAESNHCPLRLAIGIIAREREMLPRTRASFLCSSRQTVRQTPRAPNQNNGVIVGAHVNRAATALRPLHIAEIAAGTISLSSKAFPTRQGVADARRAKNCK